MSARPTRCRAGLLPALAAGLALLSAAPSPAPAAEATAIFAGGCFWCMEPPFDATPGVIATTSGYIGGTIPDPTYQQVSAGGTGYAEAVKVTFDPQQVTYAQLLKVFWRNVDPLDAGGQFCDRGDQYRSEIFYQGAEQQQLAELSKGEIEQLPEFYGKVVTPIAPAGTFYPAEDYHQDFYKKNPLRYKTYRVGCGRDRRLQQLWGDADTNHP